MSGNSTDDPKGILGRVNHLVPGDSSRVLYDDWSEDYDAHLQREFGYISPQVAAQALRQEIGLPDIEIVDYACGTGLVGIALRELGFIHVDGLDISGGMLEQARHKGVYRYLARADLSTQIALADACYDAALCVGSMGAGHIGAAQVPELLRALKPGAPFIVVINAMHYAPEGFASAFRQMERDGLWQIRRLEAFNYMTELDRPGWLLVALKRPA